MSWRKKKSKSLRSVDKIKITILGLPHFSNKQVKDFLIAGSYNHLKVPF